MTGFLRAPRLVVSCASTLVGLTLFLTFSVPAFAQNENETVGFSSTHVFDGGLFAESIDTLNGNLTLTIPIGPNYQVNKNLTYQLQLTYNSKVWEYMDRSGLNTKTKLWGQSPLGLGFGLSMGRVYRDVTYPNDVRWYFQSPDGNRHDLGPGDCWPVTPGGQQLGRGTVDRTYITATSDGTCVVMPTQITIKDGSGKRYTLGHRVDIPGTPCANCINDWRELNTAFGGWYVTLIEDMTSGVEVGGRYPNWVQVDYDWDSEHGTGVGYGQCIKQITDSLGREIRFTNWWDEAHDIKHSARTDTISFPSFANLAIVDNCAPSRNV